jgi:hypothetical protein
MGRQMELDYSTRPFRVRIGRVRLKDRRYHTRKFPEFDRTTSQLLREVSDMGAKR